MLVLKWFIFLGNYLISPRSPRHAWLATEDHLDCNLITLFCSIDRSSCFFIAAFLFLKTSYVKATAAGKRPTKRPPLYSGFVYDLPSLDRPPFSAPLATSIPELQEDNTPTAPRDNPRNMELLKLQIEKQRLEIQFLELEAHAKARSLSSPGKPKPAAIPLLDTVRTGNNAGKSQGQLDHNTRILNPQKVQGSLDC